MSTILVSNAVELLKAIGARGPDTTIVLKGGDYGAVFIDGKSGAPINLVAADADSPPSFESLTLANAKGANLDGLEFAPSVAGIQTTAGFGLTVQNSANVTVHDSAFSGGSAGFADLAYGFKVQNSSNISFSNNTFSELYKGGVFLGVDGLKLEDNQFTNIRCDGVDLWTVSNVEIANNEFSSFHPGEYDHADFIQLFTVGGTKSSENIHIHDNSFTKGDGGSVQAIFMGDDAGNLPLKNVVIENNDIQISSGHGISLLHAEDVIIRNNTLGSTPDSKFLVSVSVLNSKSVLVTSNTAEAFNLGTSVGVVATDNTKAVWGGVGVTKVSSPTPAGTEDDLIAAETGSTLDGRAGDDLLHGGNGNDVLVAGQGNDRMWGGAGADQFRIYGGDVASNQTETDIIYDLNFGENDKIILGHFQAGTFKDIAGGNFLAVSNTGQGLGSAVTIDSVADLVELVNASDSVSARRCIGTNDLLIDIREADGSVQTIKLVGQWDAYVTAGGRASVTESADELTAAASGSALDGRGGDDLLHGAQGKDVLIGGRGNDQLWGGADADRFEVSGTDVSGARSEADTINDLNFVQGDTILLSHFQSGSFKDKADGNLLGVYDSGEGAGSGVLIDSLADIVELDEQSSQVSTRKEGANDLILQITEADGSVQSLALKGLWADYAAAVEAAKPAPVVTPTKAPIEVVETAPVVSTVSSAYSDNLTASASGSSLNGRNGDDLLHGAQGNDVLIAGQGNDQMWGGGGADQFRIYGLDVVGASHETDIIYDLNFAEKDMIILAHFEAGTFKDIAGGNILSVSNSGQGAGSAVTIDSLADIVELVNASSSVSAHRVGTTNDLALDISESDGSVQTLMLSHMWSAYTSAGGIG